MPQTKAEVYYNNVLAGLLVKENNKYSFQYIEKYLGDDNNPAISLSLPKRETPFLSDNLFPFFYGLLAEGENKELQCRLLKIDENDYYTQLLKTAGQNTIGAVTVKEIE